MQKYFDTVQGSNGAIISGGAVSVYVYGSTILAPLFADRAGTVPISNPITTNALGYFEFYAANGNYTIAIAAAGFIGQSLADVQMEDPDDLAVFVAAANAAIATQVASATAQATSASNSATAAAASAATALATWAYTQAFQLVSATRNSDGAITSAAIKWPDGVSGAFTTTVLNTTFAGVIDGWSATYLGATTKTITQPAVTRDSSGAVAAQPAIVIN